MNSDMLLRALGRTAMTALLVWLPGCGAIEADAPRSSATTDRGSSAAPAPQTALDQDIADALKRMSTTLANASSLGARANISQEGALSNGQRVLLRSTAAVGMQRPDRLVVLAGSDRGNFRLTYDGQTAALHDLDANTFGASAFSGSVTALLQALESHFGVSIPLADLLSEDPFSALVSTNTTGVYIGPTVVDGIVCDHFALRSGNIDWEIWIEASDRALPRLLSTVDRNLAEHPRTILAFEDWSLAPRFQTNAFNTSPPPGSRQLTQHDIQHMRTGR